MNVLPTAIPGVLILEPRVFSDARGYFFESFSQREFDEKVVPLLGHAVALHAEQAGAVCARLRA